MMQGILDEEQLVSLADAAGVETVRMILTAFWESTDELTEQLHGAVNNDDPSGVVRLGHALKGSSANIGAALLANRALKIEDAAKNGDVETVRHLLGTFAADISSTRDAIDVLLARYG